MHYFANLIMYFLSWLDPELLPYIMKFVNVKIKQQYGARETRNGNRIRSGYYLIHPELGIHPGTPNWVSILAHVLKTGKNTRKEKQIKGKIPSSIFEHFNGRSRIFQRKKFET